MLFLSPVCTAFSQMQRSVGASPEKRRAGLKLGLDMMRFCVELAKQQEKEGRKFVLEQPAWTSCWDMEPLWSLARSKNMFLVYMDQCQVGLAVGSSGLNKKPTKFLTNCELMARVLAGRICTGGHEHERLQSGLPKLAQEYPPQLVKLLVKGLRWSLDQCWAEMKLSRASCSLCLPVLQEEEEAGREDEVGPADMEEDVEDTPS
jgi:hypothetical protein